MIHVYHQGEHLRKPQSWHLPLWKYIHKCMKENPELPSGELWNKVIVNLLKQGKSEEALEAAWKLNPKLIEKEQSKNTYKDPPLINSFEAVAELKKITDRNNIFHIYKMSNAAMNDDISYVFKSSKVSARIAIEMDVDGK